MRTNAALLLFLFCPGTGIAQQTSPPAIEWQGSYGGSSDDLLTCIRQTADGGYILGGLSLSGIGGNKTATSYGSADFWVVRAATNGTPLWDKAFDGSGWDELRSLQQTLRGGKADLTLKDLRLGRGTEPLLASHPSHLGEEAADV